MELISRERAKRLLQRARERAAQRGDAFDPTTLLSRIKENNDRFNAQAAQVPASLQTNPTPQAQAEIAEQPIVQAPPQREIASNTDTPGEFNGILDNPIVRGAGTALDFLGGATRTLGAAAIDPFVDAQLLAPGDIADALNPFDNRDAISGAELIRRGTGQERRDGQIQSSDLAGVALEIATDPLTFLSLGAVPAARGAAKALNAAGQLARGTLTQPLEQVTRLIGRTFTPKGGDVVDNFIKDPKKFRNLAKDDEKVNSIFKNITAKVDTANEAVKNQVSAKFENRLNQLENAGQLVDISDAKNSLKALRNKFSTGNLKTTTAKNQAKEVEDLVNSLIGIQNPGPVRSVVTATGTQKVGGFTELPDKLPARQADAFLKSFQEFTSTPQDATAVQKQAAGALRETAGKLSDKIFGKQLNKEFKEKVVDRSIETEKFFGSPTKRNQTPQLRASKAQTSLKSATRSDNFAVKKLFKDIGKDVGQDILKDGLDIRTLDLATSSVGRLTGSGATGAISALGEIGFKGAAELNRLNRGLVNNPVSAGAIDNLVRRILTTGAQGDGSGN